MHQVGPIQSLLATCRLHGIAFYTYLVKSAPAHKWTPHQQDHCVHADNQLGSDVGG